MNSFLFEMFELDCLAWVGLFRQDGSRRAIPLGVNYLTP